jgi:hypothetical protein
VITWVWSRFFFSSSSASSVSGGESPTPNKKFWGQQIWVCFFGKFSLDLANFFLSPKNEKKKKKKKKKIFFFLIKFFFSK